ncbi:hypothetical protein TNCV_2593351 [Trichonephila clavipes]|nr:hypothetical protein TNCV_2593351 [Trichonephila clavipes]
MLEVMSVVSFSMSSRVSCDWSKGGVGFEGVSKKIPIRSDCTGSKSNLMEVLKFRMIGLWSELSSETEFTLVLQ